MVDATISRVRMRDLARPGRFRRCQAAKGPVSGSCASRRESGTEAFSIPVAPWSGQLTPRTGDLMASTIFALRPFASRSPRLTKPLPQHQLGLKRSGNGREWPSGGTPEGCGASHLVGDAS
jgi:hypothetical protein